MEKKDKDRASADDRTSRLAERSRRRTNSPIEATPAPRVDALDATPQRTAFSQSTQQDVPIPPTQNAEIKELRTQLAQQQKLIQLMLEQKKDEAATSSTQGFQTPHHPKPKDKEYARLVALSTKKEAAPPVQQSLESFLEAFTSSLSNATSKASISEPAKWDGKDAGYSK